MNRSIKTMIISLLLILSMPMAKLSAQVSTWDGTWEPWTHGTGTEADPFLIENAQQLAYLAYRVNNGLDAGGGYVSNHDYHYKLMVDVNLNGSETFQWTPIGYWNSDTDYQCFGGRFDGDNHTISGIYINSSAKRVGFFGYTDGSTIINLSVNGDILSISGSNAGGIIGVADGTSVIANCYNTGTVSSPLSWSYCGGIVGYAGTANITNCYNTGIVSSDYYAGGIVGQAGAANITNCYNTGTVSSHYYADDCAGGIVGYSNTANIINCYNIGTVSSYYAGGIVGNGYGTIINSYYLNTCGGNNIYGGQPMSADAMQSAEFVTILNAGSLTYKKDNQPYTNQGYPVFSGFNIETQPASSVELTSAVLNGSYTSSIFNITSQGFEYKKTTDQSYTTVNCTAGQTPYSYELSDLENGATYQYRAFAGANEGTAYGELVNFTTGNIFSISASVVCGPGIITPSGTIRVIEGENQTFEISTIAQSVIDSVKVDGVNVGPVTSYTFYNVTENHTITAYITLISTPDLEPWDGITINEPYHYENRYYICSPKELAWVAQQTNNGSFSGIIYLMNDIDLGGSQLTPSTWVPIGTLSHPFLNSSFYGRGKNIKNLYCNCSGNDNIGLFGFVENSYIAQTQLRNVNVIGKTNVGGLVGYLKNTRLALCNATGHISGVNNVGGLAGNCENLSPMYRNYTKCYACAEVEAEGNAGGLFGIIRNNDSNTFMIENSFSACIVRSQNVAGGMIGCVDLTNHESIINIADCYSNATVVGLKCGGLIGNRASYNNSYLGELNISNSYVSGSVRNGYGFIGKDIGIIETIANCTNCFFDSQSTGCDNNGIPGVSPKSTNEMTIYGVDLTGTNWVYNYGLYPQLKLGFAINPGFYEGILEMAQLSVSPIFLLNDENSSAVHSNFQVSTANGVIWSSSNQDVIAINGSYASVNPTNDETVTLTATLNGISKQFNVTVADPNTYLIYQPSDLRYIAEQCNAGVTYEGKYIKLMNDIVLPENVPNNMISIGSYPDHPFKGTFDGNEKLIYNLYIDQPNTPYQGFFGYTLNANLYNVGLVNITASGRNYTGGMVAYAKNTHMRDCYVNGGTLFALSYCGGLVGYQEQGTNSIISGCYNTCEVTGNNYVGGLIGFSNYSTVRNSYVAGRVAAQGEPVGAIIGGANEVLMYYCYFSTELTGQTNAIGWNNIGKDGEGMTNAQMRDPQFVNTLNQNLATPVWMADYTNHINNGFPIIKWQRPGTGVEEHDATPNYISLYPNPANDKVTIEGEDIRHITISNLLGQTIFDGKASGNAFEYDFSKHKTGIYLIRIETASGVAVKKVSVTR